MTVSLRWLGGGGFTLRVGRRMLALDPCLGRLFREEAGPQKAGPDELRLGLALPWCDCILVSRSSREGLADVHCVALRTGALVAAPAAACRSLVALGLPDGQVRPMEPGSTLPVAGFAIEALPAPRDAGCLGYRVRAGLITMLTKCAAGMPPDLRTDIVLAGPRERRSTLVRALREARPRLVVACWPRAAWSAPARGPGAGERLAAEAIRSAGLSARLFVPEILRENDLRCLL